MEAEQNKGDFYILIKTKSEGGRWLMFKYNDNAARQFPSDEEALKWRKASSIAGRMEYSLYKLKRIDHEQE